jgi:HSP20 family protein
VTTLVRWEPFRELASFQSEMSRFMNGLLDSPGRAIQNWVPALDVWETESDVVYAFDLPGIPEDQITIEVKDDTLSISASREKTEEVSEDGFYRYERRHGTFQRAVGLPKGVEQDAISASYEHGVLEVRVPKPAEAKPRTIALNKTVESKKS